MSPGLRGLNGGGVHQHDGDVVLNRVNAATLAAFQALAARFRSHGFLAYRADQHVEEILRNHDGFIVARFPLATRRSHRTGAIESAFDLPNLIAR